MRRQKPTSRKVIVEGKLLLEELSQRDERERVGVSGTNGAKGVACRGWRIRTHIQGKRERELKDESITRATVAPKPNRTLCHV